MTKKIPFLHSYVVFKLIKRRGNRIAPNVFKVDISKMLHIEKEYSIMLLKEFVSMGLVTSYSSDEIIFNDKEESLQILLED